MFIADKFNYCRPVIVEECDKSFIDVCGLRHCLIEKIQQNELSKVSLLHIVILVSFCKFISLKIRIIKNRNYNLSK